MDNLRAGYTPAGDAWAAREDQGYPDRSTAKCFYTFCRNGFGVSSLEIRNVWCNAEGQASEAWKEMQRRYPDKAEEATRIADLMSAVPQTIFWR